MLPLHYKSGVAIITYLLSDKSVRPSFRVLEFDVWFIMDPVKVLMEAIEKECKQFLGIMLLESCEVATVLPNCPLKKIKKETFINAKCVDNYYYYFHDYYTYYYYYKCCCYYNYHCLFLNQTTSWSNKSFIKN